MDEINQEKVNELIESLGKKELTIEEAVMKFATAMMLRLKEKEDEGFDGWDDPELKDQILKAFVSNVGEAMDDYRKFIDVANLAMMLYRFETKQWYME